MAHTQKTLADMIARRRAARQGKPDADSKGFTIESGKYAKVRETLKQRRLTRVAAEKKKPESEPQPDGQLARVMNIMQAGK